MGGTTMIASARGAAVYDTGKPCKQGHLAERYVSTRHCVVCARERMRLRATQSYHADHRERRLEQMTRYHTANREQRLEQMKRYNARRRSLQQSNQKELST